MPTYLFLIWQTYFFFLIYVNTLEIVHTCICVQNNNALEVLSDSLKYYRFVGHIFSFPSMMS